MGGDGPDDEEDPEGVAALAQGDEGPQPTGDDGTYDENAKDEWGGPAMQRPTPMDGPFLEYGQSGNMGDSTVFLACVAPTRRRRQSRCASFL
mmetsp:Transcript_2048/g.4951  ORF Transcript_2048/g.4951 Transcript_2048/m.4951 type:complete len:92 (+) Transcript_2048:257-532(+)